LNVGFIYHKIGFKQRPTIGILAHRQKNLDPPGKMWLRKTPWYHGDRKSPEFMDVSPKIPKIWSQMVLSFDHPGIWLWAIEAIDTSTGWIYTVCLEQNL
jgi:hypothetical protein